MTTTRNHVARRLLLCVLLVILLATAGSVAARGPSYTLISMNCPKCAPYPAPISQ